MIKNRQPTIIAAKKLRRKGLSHRQIARILKIGLGTAVVFTKEIRLTSLQHNKLVKNSGIFTYPKEQRSRWTSKGSNNWQSRVKHTRGELITKINDFFVYHKRIPIKKEFYSNWQAYRRIFGSWNKAIQEAGYTPNLERFTHKYIAKDGHVCDSLSEKIIDNWLSSKKLPHKHGAYYPGQTKFKSDFVVNNKHWLEFLGLKGQLSSYDKVYERKKELAKKLHINIVEIYPIDLFPNNKLSEKLDFLLK